LRLRRAAFQGFVFCRFFGMGFLRFSFATFAVEILLVPAREYTILNTQAPRIAV